MLERITGLAARSWNRRDWMKCPCGWTRSFLGGWRAKASSAQAYAVPFGRQWFVWCAAFVFFQLVPISDPVIGIR
jgi:hypothetical protein